MVPMKRYTPGHYLMIESGDGGYVKVEDVRAAFQDLKRQVTELREIVSTGFNTFRLPLVLAKPETRDES